MRIKSTYWLIFTILATIAGSVAHKYGLDFITILCALGGVFAIWKANK